jgi:excisionase family DNA binding protein
MMAARPGEVSPRWAAKKLGVSIQTVWRWCRDGELERRRDASRKYWLKRDEVERRAEDTELYRIGRVE